VRRARDLTGLIARGIASDVCVEQCAYVARWCEWATEGGLPLPDEFDDLVREFGQIPRGITMPDTIWPASDWRQFAELAQALAAAEKDFDQHLAAPPLPEPDWAALDASSVAVQQFELAGGRWTEIAPRVRTARGWRTMTAAERAEASLVAQDAPGA
jgi:hypothetical protein